MKKTAQKEWQGKTAKELVAMVAKKKHELQTAYQDLSIQKVKNVHTARSLRVEIAQLLTALRQEELKQP